MFITNFIHSLPWNPLLASDPVRKSQRARFHGWKMEDDAGVEGVACGSQTGMRLRCKRSRRSDPFLMRQSE